MAQWIRVAALADCPSGAALETVVEDRIVAIFNVDGELFALDGICPHQGGPLGCGALQDKIITCPWHGWQFNVATGDHQAATTLKHPRYPVIVQDGDVMVDLDSAGTA